MVFWVDSTAPTPHINLGRATAVMLDSALEEARSFAFAVDAAFKDAQRKSMRDSSKQQEAAALKALRCELVFGRGGGVCSSRRDRGLLHTPS